MEDKSLERYSEKSVSQEEIENQARNALITNVYIELLCEYDKVPSIDDIVETYRASTEDDKTIVNIEELKSYIITYMLECRNLCFMFGKNTCDCQHILIENLYLGDDTLFLGE